MITKQYFLILYNCFPRNILTAAHCLCKFDDLMDDAMKKDPYTVRCLPTPTDLTAELPNQIRVEQSPRGSRDNSISVAVGRRVVTIEDEGGEYSYYTWVDTAIIMGAETNGNEVNLGGNYDIGLLITKPIKFIQHINLPKQYANVSV